MAKLFSFASWNVEHFKGDPLRAERVVGLLVEQDPDVFAIFEVKGRDVFSELMSRMPTHSFTVRTATSVVTTRDYWVFVSVVHRLIHKFCG